PTSPLSSLPPLHPPRATLLPYTTLFRSTRVASWASRARQRCNRAREERRDRAHPEFVGQKRIERRSDRKRVAHEHRIGPLGFEQDRKSTRLNSSHVKSSYAVFCLKKKTR